MVSLIRTIELDKKDSNVEIEELDKGVYHLVRNGVEEIIEVLDINIETKELCIRHKHTVYNLEFKNGLDLVLDQMGIKRASEKLNTDVKAPMPGKVIEIIVKEGDVVEKGDALLILEAMKMENVLKAENNCSIKKVRVSSTENVEKNQVLIELDL